MSVKPCSLRLALRVFYMKVPLVKTTRIASSSEKKPRVSLTDKSYHRLESTR